MAWHQARWPRAGTSGTKTHHRGVWGTFRVVIPALAIDADGVRVGQGGGDYDRFLSSPAGAAPVVTVIFDDELLPLGTLPYDALDVPVRFAVTPTGHCSVGSQLS